MCITYCISKLYNTIIGKKECIRDNKSLSRRPKKPKYFTFTDVDINMSTKNINPMSTYGNTKN